MEKKEFKIGDIFMHRGTLLTCQKHEPLGGCSGCFLLSCTEGETECEAIIGTCVADCRKDGINVVFIKTEERV